jgi:hypothetical protein
MLLDTPLDRTWFKLSLNLKNALLQNQLECFLVVSLSHRGMIRRGIVRSVSEVLYGFLTLYDT